MYLQEKLFLVAITLLGLSCSPIIVTRSAATLMPFSTIAKIPSTNNSGDFPRLDLISLKNPSSSSKNLIGYSPNTSPILKLGSIGQEVKDVQSFLTKAGYYRNEVNGIFDAYTQNVVQIFQQVVEGSKNADGVIDASTWAALLQSETTLAFLEQLEKDNKVQSIACSPYTDTFFLFWTTKINPIGNVAIQVSKNNAIKQSLYKTYASPNGVAKTKKTCTTNEGDPTTIYMVVRAGKISVISDYRRDKFSRLGVRENKIERLTIGYFSDRTQQNFVPIVKKAPAGKELILQVVTPTGDRWYF